MKFILDIAHEDLYSGKCAFITLWAIKTCISLHISLVCKRGKSWPICSIMFLSSDRKQCSFVSLSCGGFVIFWKGEIVRLLWTSRKLHCGWQTYLNLFKWHEVVVNFTRRGWTSVFCTAPQSRISCATKYPKRNSRKTPIRFMKRETTTPAPMLQQPKKLFRRTKSQISFDEIG